MSERNIIYGQGDKERAQAKESERQRNMIFGLILAPIVLFPIVWILSKVFKQ